MHPSSSGLRLIDCGKASDRTRGFILLLIYENGFAPFNTIYFWQP